jgi:hypothetical protein
MAELKTKPTEQSVESFLNMLPDEVAREDCFTISRLMEKITGEKPKMWGPAIVGFGKYHYKHESGREGDICLIGFSPRKQNISLYVMAGMEIQANLLTKLGKHKAGKGCLYIKKLNDVDIAILEGIIVQTIHFLKNKYPDEQ